MSPACSGTSEHHFLCSICLEVLTDPVTTSCGHNFCKTCISTHWDTSTTSRCPVCNQVFSTKPQLKVNIMMREMVSQFRRESEKKAAAPGEVPCDVCTGTKVKALKSCLDCGVSYCETHLEPHLTASGLRRHQLVEPVENLESMMCPKHSKPLELFCLSDQTRVCLMCSVLEHRSHQLVPLGEYLFEEKKVYLQQMIQKRREKLEEIRESVRIRKEAADRGKAEGVEVDVWKNLPDNKERFYPCASVLGKQSFSSGRFYFEVQVKGKTDWDLGVVKESINRKGNNTATPKNGYWTVIHRDGNVYAACGDPPVILHLKCVPEKVGVFVDYEEGVVSFYDVDAAALIYSFTHCCFTHKLHPFFSPCLNYGGKNSAPLIICPVNQSE
uniref:E3 ubiquitin-protein ligase TRIM21-like n=1 Tax=Gouania willdenowi TaxID=441366 RepID=A0A8C5N6X5_GOUWI